MIIYRLVSFHSADNTATKHSMPKNCVSHRYSHPHDRTGGFIKVAHVFVVLAAVTAAALSGSAVLAAGLIDYQADADPTTYDGYLSEAGFQPWLGEFVSSTGTPIDDNGTLAWQVADGGANNWLIPVISTDIADGEANGWTLSTELRVLTDATTSSFVPTVRYESGDSRYRMDFAMDLGTGDPRVRLSGESSISVTLIGGVDAYHVYSLVYTPGSGADLFVDDVEMVSDMLPFGTGNWAGAAVQWGDSTGASTGGPTVNYNYVKWDGGGSVAEGLPGDYNGDGIVAAADYTVWRDNVGADTLPFNRDPNIAGAVGDDDYDVWVANFGMTADSGAAATAATVPEPSTSWLAVFAVCGLLTIAIRR